MPTTLTRPSMDVLEKKGLRTALHEYTQRSTLLAITLLMVDILAYVTLISGAVYLDMILLKLVCVLVAGVSISALFVIGHDAAHGCYTTSKLLNQIIGRIAFLPSLHNFSLWQIAHNRLHHRLPNFKGLNSWSPLSKAEYDALPVTRRLVERLYRTPLGLGVYYLVERWWKDKFFPTLRVVNKHRTIYWVDFSLLIGYLLAFIVLLGLVGESLEHKSPWTSILWGFVLPFVVWNFAMGFTVYLQHTNLRVPWFTDEAQWHELRGQEDVTVHVRFPSWYGLASHEIMEHTAHHVNPKIPLYRLKRAQQALASLLGERMVSERFTPRYFLQTMARCKLYDFETHRWLDFHGSPTSECTLTR